MHLGKLTIFSVLSRLAMSINFLLLVCVLINLVLGVDFLGQDFCRLTSLRLILVNILFVLGLL